MNLPKRFVIGLVSLVSLITSSLTILNPATAGAQAYYGYGNMIYLCKTGSYGSYSSVQATFYNNGSYADNMGIRLADTGKIVTVSPYNSVTIGFFNKPNSSYIYLLFSQRQQYFSGYYTTVGALYHC